MENCKWRKDSAERITQKIAKKLKNQEQFVAKKQIEQDKQKIMNCPRTKIRIPTIVTQLLTQSQVLRSKTISLSYAREIYDPETASSSNATHVPSQPLHHSESQNHALPRFWSMMHGTLWEIQETLLSTIQRIWYPLLTNWDLRLQEIQSNMKVKWDKNRKIRQHLYHAPKVDVDCESILVELVLTVVCTDQNSGNTKIGKGKTQQ